MGDDTSRKADRCLTDEHAAFLTAAAVDIDLAQRLGVHSVLSVEDVAALGDPDWVNYANFPSIAFPWTNEDGEVMWQMRPDTPTVDQKSGKPRKYVFSMRATPKIWAVRPVEDARTVVFIEGTKQCLAGASYAPDGIGIYGFAGARLWQQDGIPLPDLGVADGRDVVVLMDADSATNADVFDAAIKLGEALKMEGATKVSYARLIGAAKAGLDDVLAGRKPERRASWLARLLLDTHAKPADKRPVPAKKGSTMTADEGRVTIIVNRDRLAVINELTDALLKRWNAKELFCHGGVISRLNEGGGMTPVDKGSFHDIVQHTAVTLNETEGAQGVKQTPSWPDTGVMSATMSRAGKFASLDRIAHAPFVRPDGTIVTQAGYDEATLTLLLPDPVFEGLTVPDNPTADEILSARKLLMDEWLGDFPLAADADRANLLGLLVTPAIRGLCPRAPMAVLDGLQMGVGKNLLADQLLTVYTGQAAQPMNWVSEPDELRKQITSAFRTGAEFFVFDEAHTLDGAPLAQALTAETWQDRILGVSNMANFPNRVTWISLGNNVQVKGDITRRVYRIALRPTYANPQDRLSSSFRHPDLGSWTRAHRRDLLGAILTLVRAWFAKGQPYPERGVSFGSFEAWERIVGGIVQSAGLPSFLGNLKVWRSESDFDSQYWTAHLAWLREQFGAGGFTTAQVKSKAMAGGTDLYDAPPRLDDYNEKAYGKALGEAYARAAGRRYGSYWLDKEGTAHGHVNVWRVHVTDELPPPPSAPPTPEPEPNGPTPDPDTEVSTSWDDPNADVLGDVAGAADSMRDPQPVDSPVDDVVVFDLETGDAGDQFKHPGPGYTRIGATATGDEPVTAYHGLRHVTVPDAVVHDIRRGRVITGHNVMAFDLPVLVREGVMTMPEVHQLAADGRVFDTLLAARFLDPPMARDKGVDAERKYDLGTLGAKYQLGEKLTDVSKPLAKKYGDWGKIPIDLADPDPERAQDAADFQRYMIGDVELSRSLYARLMEELGGTMPDYLVREHRIAAIAAQISHNGFLVDQTLLVERVEEIRQRKAGALELLAGRYGVPLADAKGTPYKSPLATKGGKQAIGAALLANGVPEKALWRTPKSGDLQLSADAMLHYGREYGGHNKEIRILAKTVHRIVSARSIYETTLNALCPDGRVHPGVSFKQATGRWSLTNPGLTVFGKRGGRHVERDVLLPDPGEKLVAFDLSQVDMRAVAGLSGDPAYISMLMAEDPHSELAFALFGDRSMREVAKPIGHGWNYGESLKRISMENNIEPRLVMQFDEMMRERFGGMVQWREDIRALAGSGQLLDNGFGRLMRPDPRRAHTQGPALMGQGAARDIMMQGMLRLPAECLPMLRAQVHDEIVLSIPEDQVEDVSRAVIDALSFEWRGVPILADRSRAGTSWGMCYAKG